MLVILINKSNKDSNNDNNKNSKHCVKSIGCSFIYCFPYFSFCQENVF